MDLNPAEIRDLAAFFAKRFPEPEARARLGVKAGLDHAVGSDAPDPVRGWSRVLGEAVRRGRLRHLVLAAQASLPQDENLQELGALFRRRPDPLPVLALAGALAAVLVGVVAVGLVGALSTGGAEALRSGSDSGQPLADLVSTSSGAASGGSPAAAQSPPAAPSPPAPGSQLVSDPSAAAAVDDATNAPEAAPEVPSAISPSPRSAVQLANESGRCTAGPGELVGYWYAGRSAPARAGQRLVLDRSVNVRSDYPDAHNSYDARTPIRCVLRPGDVLVLSKAPVEVPGGAYWVPLVTGDLRD